MALYGDDLAHVHAAGFGGFAAEAAPGLVARLRSMQPPAGSVVDIGCGAGVTTRALTDAGFDVLAIEPSTALLELARSHAPAARFQCATAYEAALGPCGAILAVGEPLTYHRPDADADALLQGFFRRAAAVLPSGGQLVFDVIVTGTPTLNARGWSAGYDWAVLYETREEPSARRVTRTIELFRSRGGSYRRSREVHDVRLFDEAAIRAWLESASFDVETARAYGDHPLAPRRVAFFGTRRPPGA